MRRLLMVLCALTVLPAAPATAAMDHADGAAVPIYNAAFAVPHVDVLAGDTVTWHNDSVRTHNVNADDGSFASPRLFMSGTFWHRFDTPGTYAYYCQLHPSMRGDVGVHRVLLDAAKEPAAPGKPYVLSGRAALPEGGTVSIEAGGVVAASATVAAGGTFSATVTPQETTAYTAVVDGESAPPVQVIVLDRKVSATQQVSGKRIAVDATVTPASVGATVVLQLRLKEHFGWWPVRVAKLDATSRVRFTLPRGRKVSARVLLTASDAATELARSATFRLR
ncbi:MAG TPA: plastocyanin/azurin family copper-binding protein [Solirubrobacter sp.]